MEKYTKWLKKHQAHFIAWAVFIFYECVVVRFTVGENGAFMAYLTHYSIVITYFYFHALLFLPWALKQKVKAIWRLPIGLLFEIFTFVLVYFIDDLWLDSMHVKLLNGHPVLNSQYFTINMYRVIYFFAFATAYYYLKTFLKEKSRSDEFERQSFAELINRQRIEQELTHAQNAFLKAQINPHLLFNTLDFVYHNVCELSPKAAEAVVTLSEMMRYAMDADKIGEFICISDEIEQVQNLKLLYRLRKNEDMPLKLIYSDEVKNISFIPLVLLTLAENIFKHGDLQNGQKATMKLYIEKGLFVIETENVSSRKKSAESHHTGLLNIEQRLKHAYGNSVYFDYSLDNDNHFRLMINVPAQQLQDVSVPSPAFASIGTILPHAFAGR